jgi:prepilin-type N-terminal cleavage/methylation domain-containing protein
MRRQLLRTCARVRSRLADQRGYTLPELVTTMAILSIVLGGIGDIFVSASRASTEMNKRFQSQQQSLLALDSLRRELHCATSVSPSAGSAVQSITLTMNSTCTTGTGSITWCTIANGTMWDLWRTPGAACTSTGGVKKASYLTLDHVFTPTAGSSSSLPQVHVDFPVNIKGPSATTGTYKLTDDIVERNGTRS